MRGADHYTSGGHGRCGGVGGSIQHYDAGGTKIDTSNRLYMTRGLEGREKSA